MKKERKETVSQEIKYHEFYCDGCGKKLGESVELDDGYYDCYGDYEQSFYIKGFARLNLRKNYCISCAQKKDREIVKALRGLGFIED